MPDTNGLKIDGKPINAMGRTMIWAALAVATFLVELIIFSLIAMLFGVSINIETMPLNWLFGFYALFVLPSIMGVFSFLAFTRLFT